MHRDEINALIEEINSADGSQRFLFGNPAEQVFAGLGASLTPRPGQYNLLVMLESWSAEAVEASERLEQRAPGQIRVEVTGSFQLDVSTSPVPPTAPGLLSSGDSIGPSGRDVTGTLGFFASLGSGHVALVSNAHVLAPDYDGALGAPISSPGLLDGTQHEVARVSVAPAILDGVADLIDAAAATLLEGVECSIGLAAAGCLEPQPMQILDAMVRDDDTGSVSKIGRTTGLTHGTIDAIDGRLYNVMYGSSVVTLTGMILIAGQGGKRFTQPGDSGALVFSSTTNRPVGLHVGSSTAAARTLSACHPISAVLDALGATIWTGTEHDD